MSAEVRPQPARPQNEDEGIERGFILDYISLGLLINFRSLVVLLKAARDLRDENDRKSICLSAWQGLLSSFEDFAMLLQAIIKKATHGRYLHQGLGFERRERQGSTDVPGILKRFNSPREFLDTLGFNSIDIEALRRTGIEVLDEQAFSDYYRDFAEGVTEIGKLQTDYNELKNRLKHGKAVLSNGENEITFLKWNEGADPGWSRTHIETTLRQMEVAVIQTAKIYLRSLDFLLSFLMHYHPDHVAEFQKTAHERMEWCVEQVRALGLDSQGLTRAA